MGYVGQGDATAHSAVNLVLDFNARFANAGTSAGTNSPAVSLWTDLSGNGNNGTLTNFGYSATSGWGGAGTIADPNFLLSDGTNDFVTVPNNTLFNISTLPLTMEIWVSFNKFIAEQYIISKNKYIQYSIHILSNTTFVVSLEYEDYTFTCNLATNTLYHIVVTCSASGLLTCYLNNTLLGSATILTGAVVTPSATPFLIAKGETYYSNQKTYACRIYTRCLTTEELMQNYSAGALLIPKALPVINISGVDRSRISRITGYNTSNVTFTSDLALMSWEARATPSGTTPARGVGVIVGSGGALSAGATAGFNVTDVELTQGDVLYTIKIYGQDLEGSWSS